MTALLIPFRAAPAAPSPCPTCGGEGVIWTPQGRLSCPTCRPLPPTFAPVPGVGCDDGDDGCLCDPVDYREAA